MDRKTHQRILSEIYGCGMDELLAQFERMTPLIRQSAIYTLAFEKEIAEKRKTVHA